MADSNHGVTVESQGRVQKTVGDLVTWANAAKALAGAVVAVGGAWAAGSQGCGPPPPPPAATCADVRAERPEGNILLSRWGTTEFRLRGKNDCGRDLTVHVAFFALSESFRFQPPAGCPSERPMMDDPECWAVQTVGEGEVDWAFFPPALHPLHDPLRSRGSDSAAGDGVVAIDMRWVVYADQAHIVDAQTQRIAIRDDRVAG